jgi:hypothetical protein
MGQGREGLGREGRLIPGTADDECGMNAARAACRAAKAIPQFVIRIPHP